MNIRYRYFLTTIFLFIVHCTLLPQDRKDLQDDLRHTLLQKMLSLRDPHFGRQLEFNSSGNLLSKAEAGPWSTCGLLRVENLVLGPNRLEIDGRRIVLGITRSDMQSDDTKIATVVTNEQVRIAVEMSGSNMSEANNILSKIFQGERLEERVATYWKPGTLDVDEFRRKTPNAIVGELEGNRPVFLANPGRVDAPKPIHTPEPTYTEIARKDKLQGTAVLWVVVNEKGLPEVLEIKKGLGEGLDTQTMATVSKWRFQPAMREGQPVAVLIYVQVRFHLY